MWESKRMYEKVCESELKIEKERIKKFEVNGQYDY